MDRPTVLLLDDDLMHGALVGMVLGDAGFEIRVATTEQEAREAMVDGLPDCIMAGWDADGLDGLALVRRLRSSVPRLAEVPTLLVTDRQINGRTRLELSIEGIRWILEKPVVVTSLPKLVQCTVAESETRRTYPSGRHCSARIVDSGTTASAYYLAAV
jgi:DNA-binding response OmpR family regulator